MKQILFLFIGVLFFAACSTQISNGPEIEFSNEISWPDTIKEDSTIQIPIKAQGVDASINSLQIFVNDEEYFDTIFPAQNLFSMIWNANFFEKSGVHDIKIQTTDTDDLIALTHKSLYVQALKIPQISFDSSYVYSDSTTQLNQNLQFSVTCKKGERLLDSLYVLYNKRVIYTYPNAIYTSFNDTLQIVPFTFIADSIGEFSLQFKLLDVSKKKSIVTKKITVIE